MKRLLLRLSHITLFAVFIILIYKFLFPFDFQKNLTKITTLLLNENTNDTILKKYGIKLNFNKSEWIYNINYDKDSLRVQLLKTSDIYSKSTEKCNLENLELNIYKNENLANKVIDLITYNCQNKKIIINGKEFLLYFCKEALDKKTDKNFYDMHLILLQRKNIIFVYRCFNTDRNKCIDYLKKIIRNVDFISSK